MKWSAEEKASFEKLNHVEKKKYLVNRVYKIYFLYFFIFITGCNRYGDFSIIIIYIKVLQ